MDFCFLDLSNRYTREAIDKRILKLLCQNESTPAILVLNKLDICPQERSIYNLIYKLTCGYINGRKSDPPKPKNSNVQLGTTAESYIKRKLKVYTKKTVLIGNKLASRFT